MWLLELHIKSVGIHILMYLLVRYRPYLYTT